MEAELRAKYPDASIALIAGSGGVFDIMCNGRLVYSMRHIGGQRFPNDGEIAGLIEKEIA